MIADIEKGLYIGAVADVGKKDVYKIRTVLDVSKSMTDDAKNSYETVKALLDQLNDAMNDDAKRPVLVVCSARNVKELHSCCAVAALIQGLQSVLWGYGRGDRPRD